MTAEKLWEQVLSGLGRAASCDISHGQLSVDVGRDSWIDALTFVRDALDCSFFDWLSAVDELDGETPGFTVVAHLYSPARQHHLLLRTLVPRDDHHLPTATTVYRGANWHERETYEMFGVVFDGHPNLIPLLLPDGFEGNPLRKDFVLASRVAKPWPGAVDPGQSVGDVKPHRRRNLPPGVPNPDQWGPGANSDAEP